MALYRRHDRDKDSRRKAAFVAALMPVPKAPKAIPGWLMAQFAEEAERERIRKAEIQEAADRARWLMKQGALGGCKWLQERGYQSDGRAPGVGRFDAEGRSEALPRRGWKAVAKKPQTVDPLDVLASLIR